MKLPKPKHVPIFALPKSHVMPCNPTTVNRRHCMVSQNTSRNRFCFRRRIKHTYPRAWLVGVGASGWVASGPLPPKKRVRQPIAPQREMVESLSIPPARWHRGGPSSVSCFCFLTVNLMLKQAAARSVVWPEKGTG